MSSASERSVNETTSGRTVDTSAGSGEGKRVKLSQRNEQQRRDHQHHQQQQQEVGRGVVESMKKYRGHRDGVWDVDVTSFGLDGSRSTNMSILGTASADRTARLWNVENGSCLVKYTGHRGSVNSIRFHRSRHSNEDDSYDGLVLTASGDRSAHVWKVPPGADCSNYQRLEEEELASANYCELVETTECQLNGHVGVVIAADWLAGGVGDVITASWDCTAMVHCCETGRSILHLNGHADELLHCSGHRSAALALTSSKDATFRLWDLRDALSPANVCRGHTRPVMSAVFALRTCDVIVSGSDDSTVCIWDLRSMTTPTLTISAGSPVNRLSVSKCDQLIALPQDNSYLQLFNFSGVRLGKLTKSHGRMVCSTTWGKNETETKTNTTISSLFTCGFDRRVIGWKVSYEFRPRSDAG